MRHPRVSVSQSLVRILPATSGIGFIALVAAIKAFPAINGNDASTFSTDDVLTVSMDVHCQLMSHVILIPSKDLMGGVCGTRPHIYANTFKFQPPHMGNIVRLDPSACGRVRRVWRAWRGTPRVGGRDTVPYLICVHRLHVPCLDSRYTIATARRTMHAVRRRR